MRIHLLGAPVVEKNGEPVEIKRRKDLALLAYLAVTSQVHRREVLATLLWPEHDSSRAFSNLRRSIWEIKQVVGEELLVVERDSVYLRKVPEVWLDVVEFQSKLNDPNSLPEAIDLYRGDFMAGFTLPDSPGFDDWQYFTRDELRRALANALENQTVELEQTGNYDRAIQIAQRWLSLDVLNEAAHRRLMTLYAWSGERAAAIRQYQECMRILEEELGLPPEADTTHLFERIQSGEVEKKRAAEDGKLTHVSNLPIPPTPFIGRRLELDQLHSFLDDPRCHLVTLLGPGGVGKTRLAVQAAEEFLEKFSYDVYFVALAGVENPQAILPAIASALKFSISSAGESPQDQLLNYLRQKRLLLVLDNFEHLTGGAIILAEITAQAKEVKVLITSREKLGLQGEWVYEIGGMQFPEESASPEMEAEDYSAIQLFIQSARRAQPDFNITPENLSPVVHIAQLVRGMPLALELAAAWVVLLSCQEIATEIERSLDILETGMQDVPERQRSMRAVFDHTWNLLNERERDIFARMSVFRGGFSLQAVQEIFAVSPVELRAMVGKSLLKRTTEGRFEIHELLRQYAAGKLAQDAQAFYNALDQHSEYFSRIAKELGRSIHRSQQQQNFLIELNADIDNALAAWNWAIEHHKVERLAQATEAFAIFLLRQVRVAEGITLFKNARDILGEQSTPAACHLQARLLAWEGTFQRIQRNFETAERLFHESLSILEDPEIDQEAAIEDRALSHWGLGFNAFQTGDVEGAKNHYDISLKLFRQTGKKYYEAEVLSHLAGIHAYLVWDAKGSQEYWEEALQIKRELGDLFNVAGILYEMGIIAAYHLGDVDRAIELFQESSGIYSRFSDQASKIFSTRSRAQILHLTARYAENLELWEEQRRHFEEVGNRDGLAWSHSNLGLTHHSLGNYAQAEAHLRQAWKILDRNPEEDIQKGIIRWSLGMILLTTDRLQEAMEFIETSLKIDRQMTGKHNLGRDLSALGMVEFLLGDKEKAWLHTIEAIELFLQYQHYDWMVYAASTLAVQFADQGEIERALTLYGMITCYPEAATSQWFEDVFWCHIHKITTKLPPEKTEAIIERGTQLDIWQYISELIEELRSRHL